MEAYFVALTPDNKTRAEVAEAKLAISSKFGNQTYLLDPAHLTLYVALAENLNDVEKRLEQLANTNSLIKVEIANEWQEFPGDKFAGGGTSLALKFREQDKEPIVALQKKVVETLNELRQGEIHPRYKHEGLPYSLQESIDRYGYPFVSSSTVPSILIPHISLCCFNPPENAEEFKRQYLIERFSGPAILTKLALYKLCPDDKLEFIRYFPLRA